MKALFDITRKDCIQFFNRISRILYSESTGEQKHMLRSILANVIEHDITMSVLLFQKNILTDDNFIAKYCFYDHNENGEAIREYRVYIVKDIPDEEEDEKLYIDINYEERLTTDDIDTFYIYIHQDMCSDKSTIEDKFDSLVCLFKLYMTNLSLISEDDKLSFVKVETYSSLISLVFSSLLIEYSTRNMEIEHIVHELLSTENSYLVNGVPEVRLSINKADEIFGIIKNTTTNAVIKNMKKGEQG